LPVEPHTLVRVSVCAPRIFRCADAKLAGRPVVCQDGPMAGVNVRRVAKAGLLASVAGAGITAASVGIAWQRLARRALPQEEGRLGVPGLRGAVTGRRDRWGVPHIDAGERWDMHFGQGFVHAQERLWQMHFYQRVVSGRLSEFAGAEPLPVDRLLRTLGIRRVAEREAEELDPELRALMQRFCDGVNAGAAAAKAPPFEMRLPGLEGEPWTPVDILSKGKLLAFGLSTNWERELLRADMVRALGPELTARLDPAYPADNPVVEQTPWGREGLPVGRQNDEGGASLGVV